jgi:hypothetical protein
MTSLPRLRAIAAGVFMTGALAVAPSAHAATLHGITPLAPKDGASVPAGQSPTFKMLVKGPGQVFVHVCTSKEKNSDGVICSESQIGPAKKSGSTYSFKPEFFNFPKFWLNTPGTYYWQAYRISCDAGINDCLQEGPIVTFKVG